MELRISDSDVFKDNTERGKWGVREGQLPHIADTMELFDKSWRIISQGSILRSWLKITCLSETQKLR